MKTREKERKSVGPLEPLIRIYRLLSLSVFLKLSQSIVQHRTGKEKVGLRGKKVELRSIAPPRHRRDATVRPTEWVLPLG